MTQLPFPSLDDGLWREVPNLPGYLAHPLGFLYNQETRRISGGKNDGLEQKVSVIDGNVRIQTALDQIIAETFVEGKDPNKRYVIHQDSDFSNNAADNLIWATKAEKSYSNRVVRRFGVVRNLKGTFPPGTWRRLIERYPSLQQHDGIDLYHLADIDETWLIIEDVPNYQVSDYGRVKAVDSPDPRQLGVTTKGVVNVTLIDKVDGARRTRQSALLVAHAFLEPATYHLDKSVWHIDGDVGNCEVENLKWETRTHVTEWMRMNREGTPKFKTPCIKDLNTGVVYRNAFECAMDLGVLESNVVWRVEKFPWYKVVEGAPFRYIRDDDPEYVE